MDQFDKFYALCLRFLSFRPRSEKEIRDYLARRNAEPVIVSQVVTKLKEQSFLNDEEFARIWVESRNRSKPRSQKLLRFELKQKGIDLEIIDQLLTSDPSAPFRAGQRQLTDLELAKKIIDKKISKLKNLGKQEVYKKIGGLLSRRGFNWDTIKQAVDETLDKEV